MILSKELQKLLNNYQIYKDEEGMSPASVYKCIGNKNTLFLKTISNKYTNTTYDLEREKDVMLWLNNKINVPKVLFYEEYNNIKYLLMNSLPGIICDNIEDREQILKHYVYNIKKMQALDISDCPFNSSIEFRLQELQYLLDNNIADININNWEANTKIKDPLKLYSYLKQHKPQEELVFSHGDFGGSNIIVHNNKSGLIDLARCGYADKWLDIAFVVREYKDDKKYLNMFFNMLEEEPDWEKINYYIPLDELF